VSCFRAFLKSNATYTTRGQVANHPPSVTVTLLLVAEHGLESVAEGKVEGLGWEVTDHIGRVTTPQRDDTLVGGGAAETVRNTLVLVGEAASFQHLILLTVFWLAPYSLQASEVTGNLQLQAAQDCAVRRTAYLVLDEELHTLNRSGSSLRDGGGNTTHYYPLSV